MTLPLKTLKGMLFAPTRYPEERLTLHGILFSTVPSGHACSPLWTTILIPVTPMWPLNSGFFSQAIISVGSFNRRVLNSLFNLRARIFSCQVNM